MRLEAAIQQAIAQACDLFRIGVITALVGNQITVTVAGAPAVTIPRLSTWNAVVGDQVLIAVTPAGWVALGAIA